jgi:hypothetical protein
MTGLPGRTAVLALALGFFWKTAPAQQRTTGRTAAPSSALASGEWRDSFDGRRLDPAEWEPFGFEGDQTATADVSDGQLRLRGKVGSRAGVRTRPMFVGDSYVVEATVTRIGRIVPDPSPTPSGVSPAAPEPEVHAGDEHGVSKGAFQEDPSAEADLPAGNAILTLLFDDTGDNRIEWLLNSEGVFEAWAVLHNRGERLDMGNIGTRVPNPRLAIARRGDEFSFMLNDRVAFTRAVRGVPRAFRVFLYGFSSSENGWDAVRVSVARPR